MKQIDKKTERRLRWLFLPCVVIAIIIVLDLLLGWNLNAESWGNTALMIALAIPLLAYCIVSIRQKCWGVLAVILIIATITYLNMANVFVNLLVPNT